MFVEDGKLSIIISYIKRINTMDFGIYVIVEMLVLGLLSYLHYYT